eukprot:946007-Heterocapsa_arctica.AAC.1
MTKHDEQSSFVIVGEPHWLDPVFRFELARALGLRGLVFREDLLPVQARVAIVERQVVLQFIGDLETSNGLMIRRMSCLSARAAACLPLRDVSVTSSMIFRVISH